MPALALACLALACLALSGGALPASAQPSPRTPFDQYLFPPEMIMGHQRELGITDAQRNTIKDAVHAAQSKFLDLQWRMESESETMSDLVQDSPVDESAVLAKVDKLLDIERDVKKTQLSMLIKIKNALTDDQRSRLAELRRAMPPMPPNPPMARMPPGMASPPMQPEQAAPFMPPTPPDAPQAPEAPQAPRGRPR